ncbi:enoyl-CoA hydratase [Bordetella genomosp. 7]|uniref:Enoyl-CoA hydratase n=1 Tax=Bordetella genomosp. 7 TaxID=1416805 RepID=A0A261QYR7_9BORD|nr:enoyl-CoA hydratase/isomerase family protein [Bordetella genomosp. 7]OZI17861.1 enoyl-CoA hydratase [Bordetella genomosp. 7]OZI21662.1 enoyl-CoA hydratase [Bordetella genomosp. 7]
MTELQIENQDAVRILCMNRPDKHNALNTALTQALLDALRAADRDSTVRAVVLAGNGRSFCAGADTREFAGLTAQHADAVSRRAELTTELHQVFSLMGKPVVSAVHGNALGGGAGLALACDMTVAADDMRFGYPELRHGIVAAVVMANLVRQVGRKQAFELVALAEPIDGARALALGLANRVVPAGQVRDTALELARRMAAWDPAAMKLTKRSFHRAADLGLAEALAVGRDANTIMRSFGGGGGQ